MKVKKPLQILRPHLFKTDWKVLTVSKCKRKCNKIFRLNCSSFGFYYLLLSLEPMARLGGGRGLNAVN